MEEQEMEIIKKSRKKFRLTGSVVAKVLAFLLLFISIAAAIGGVVCCYIAAEEGMYVDSAEEVLRRSLRSGAVQAAYTTRDCLENGFEETALYELENSNAEVAILKTEDELAMDSSVFLWQSYDEEEAKAEAGYYSDLYVDIRMPSTFFEKPEFYNGQGKEYIFRVFFDPEFSQKDNIRNSYDLIMLLYDFRYAVIGLTIGCALFALMCFIFLLCSAGHKNGREGIVPGVFTGIYFDVFTAMVLAVASLTSAAVFEITRGNDVVLICVMLWCAILFMLWLMDFAIRAKMGGWWKHTLVYAVLRTIWHGGKKVTGVIFKLLSGIPLVITTVIIYLGVCILEFCGCLFFVPAEGVFLWALEKIVLLFGVLYIALTCKKLLDTSKELAEGKENCRVDTKYMFGDFKEHGENLNSLGQGISKAVAERMKSEHLKTELITNVSHDLKTPLTSIINYADLICEEQTENPKIAEYSEVLLRQSKRLKKLLEDLLEASKATTGNVEVNLEACEVGVLLTQAVGEYQQRMEERGLELKVSQPEEPIKIMADGRHLWRVFDNLLNNVCKYAQENSRVYLSLEQRQEKVCIIFRNMSKYALDISPEELEERFVRGDKSRHMEGNGLGLSIAKSLTALQGGNLDIVIDGDLFKVTLTFDALSE